MLIRGDVHEGVHKLSPMVLAWCCHCKLWTYCIHVDVVAALAAQHNNFDALFIAATRG